MNSLELVQILRQRVPVYVAYDIAEMVYKMEHQEKMAETLELINYIELIEEDWIDECEGARTLIMTSYQAFDYNQHELWKERCPIASCSWTGEFLFKTPQGEEYRRIRIPVNY